MEQLRILLRSVEVKALGGIFAGGQGINQISYENLKIELVIKEIMKCKIEIGILGLKMKIQ